MEHERFMQEALRLAKQGEGFVEPNPMVGCVIVQNQQIIAQGFHSQFGKAHAEIEALRNAAGTDLTGATLYVTLEPCSHHGKTPPCTDALLRTGIRRIVTAMRDPNPKVNGQGLQILRNAGIEVIEDVLKDEAERLNAPYLTLVQKQRPFIICKWSMTLDGKLATRTQHSAWISNGDSRQIVQHLRSRMDAVMTGSGTVQSDNPLLTVRLSDAERQYPRRPLRIILDSNAFVPLNSRLVQTAGQYKTLIVTGPDVNSERCKDLQQAGCELLRLKQDNPQNRLSALLAELGRRQITNLLVEGGGKLFGSLFDLGLIDEVHAFIAPKLIGGEKAVPVFGGSGVAKLPLAAVLKSPVIQTVGSDVYVRGRLK
ncbi:MAG: bifunctional diaminohydroxyphosphoribosylaminopyrimidine deaminase/5-amino-6-(5-phosphoribosylamino)uracil reductase RibD [Planctomycetaceae bacterium]|jgi:diaminohydroxyphosphoribosylaminopyrimidine deaminase/5-amino-6-(5-phosphoribosylamino)uracil reductase|nr:bifunctional diaminohydroxyphosphoribosylaminopyrimidine deaminase/5-amino-6-(5-phosphoribosylamino)uracil reductase RibD [Planctomycetaceae bacterium]